MNSTMYVLNTTSILGQKVLREETLENRNSPTTHLTENAKIIIRGNPVKKIQLEIKSLDVFNANSHFFRTFQSQECLKSINPRGNFVLLD